MLLYKATCWVPGDSVLFTVSNRGLEERQESGLEGDIPGSTLQLAHMLKSFQNILYFKSYYVSKEDLVLMILCPTFWG